MLRASRLFRKGCTKSAEFAFSKNLFRPSPLQRFAAPFSNEAGDAATILSGTNATYIDEMYSQWSANPASVHASWDVYFSTGTYAAPPESAVVGDYVGNSVDHIPVGRSSGTGDMSAARDIARVAQYIRAFQVRGHFLADLDPLNYRTKDGKREALQQHEELHISNYGFTEADLDREVDLKPLGGSVCKIIVPDQPLTLRQIRDRLKAIYCGSIGFEYMHIPNLEKINWIRENIETSNAKVYSKKQKHQVLDRLTWADHFERVLAQKYATAKRFGLEGAESFIPGVKTLLDVSSTHGVENVIIGMPHRGRLNMLSSVVRKPLEMILSEFDGTLREMEEGEYSGDVKYHLGATHDRDVNGSNVHITLMANPSHLEAVNTCVLGKVRAKQFYAEDTDRSKSMGLILHGDAAFSGQGIVYETLGLGDLPDYTTGGTIHVVVNNQVGFTTDPYKSRSSPYCSDVAKTVNAPIFHVNGDDTEAVVRVSELAAEYRAKFSSDVVIDIVCYRKHGHNEIDEPSFTQPLMYDIIKKHPSTLDIYQKKLVAEGSFTQEEVQAVSDRVHNIIEEKYEIAKSYVPPALDSKEETLSSSWEGMLSKGAKPEEQYTETGVSIDTLHAIGAKVCEVPEGFNMHRRLKGVMDKKRQALEAGKGLDWSCGEALAFGSLIAEKNHVRLSGQDVERGTFSHRHAVWHDQKTGETHTALNHLGMPQAEFSVSNSNLSEYGVLGFELGYSMERPDSLVMWEAQFGDFANGAQTMIDQFICSQEDKWLRQTGLVMLLPHGYEGMGPEHSSARLERYLQLSDSDLDTLPDNDDAQVQAANWQIIMPTTPASIFHALRRQVHRKFRKPLIVMSPKSLLRHPMAKSDIADFGPGTRFRNVIPDQLETLAAPDKVKRLVLCSGKVYYDLADSRAKHNIDDIAIVRLEQLNPFPFNAVKSLMSEYPNAEVVWCQEEPKNQGAWNFVRPAIETSAMAGESPERPSDFVVTYVGRRPMAATSTGYAKVHAREQDALVSSALML